MYIIRYYSQPHLSSCGMRSSELNLSCEAGHGKKSDLYKGQKTADDGGALCCDALHLMALHQQHEIDTKPLLLTGYRRETPLG